MKGLMLCACVLILASSSSTELKTQLKDAMKSIEDDFKTCMNKYEITWENSYKEDEIMTNVYAEPENEEKTRKHGCWIACVVKKQNLMDGTNIKEAEVHAKLNGIINDSPALGIAHRIARKCMKEVRGITQECEKGFSLYACVAKTTHKYMKHGEHERKETEEEVEEEIEEATKQTE